MHGFGAKTRQRDPFETEIDPTLAKKQSRFSILFNQAFDEVKRKISFQDQNLPLLKLKSYSNSNQQSQKLKPFHSVSQRQEACISNPFTRNKSINTISVRYSASPKRLSVNKILWEKKISLETLRIFSTKRTSKDTLSKQFQQESLKHLRHKTSDQSKDIAYDEQYNFYSHMSITPLNILSSKAEREKYLNNKKKVEDQFKLTFYNEKERNLNKKGHLKSMEPSDDGSFKNKLWQVDRDEDEFINFVKQKTNSPNYN